MADPKPYKRGYSFENYQADVPDQPLPGVNLDIELDKIAGASDELTARVNAGIDVSINNEALEAVAAEVPKMVFVADNMSFVREVADLGPNLELATDLFLGAFANDPDTTGDGDPLSIGATYYNTLIGESRVWAGPTSGWIPVAKVSTGGVLQGGTTVSGGATEFLVGDYVSIMLARNGLVLEPGTDYTMTSPTVTVPGAVDGDRLSWFAILKGTTTDAASFVRQTVLTTAGRKTYDTNTAGGPLNLSQTNHVLFGGSPFGMLTYGVDYTVADGELVLDFVPAAGELFHIFSMPRFTNSEAQVLLQEYEGRVRADADRAETAAFSAQAAALSSGDSRIEFSSLAPSDDTQDVWSTLKALLETPGTDRDKLIAGAALTFRSGRAYRALTRAPIFLPRFLRMEMAPGAFLDFSDSPWPFADSLMDYQGNLGTPTRPTPTDLPAGTLAIPFGSGVVAARGWKPGDRMLLRATEGLKSADVGAFQLQTLVDANTPDTFSFYAPGSSYTVGQGVISLTDGRSYRVTTAHIAGPTMNTANFVITGMNAIGEDVYIDIIVGDTIYLTAPLRYTYVAASRPIITRYENMGSFHISGLNIIGNDPANLTDEGRWVTGRAYTTSMMAFADGSVGGNSRYYACVVPHTSTTFAADLAAGRWVNLGGDRMMRFDLCDRVLIEGGRMERVSGYAYTASSTADLVIRDHVGFGTAKRARTGGYFAISGGFNKALLDNVQVHSTGQPFMTTESTRTFGVSYGIVMRDCTGFGGNSAFTQHWQEENHVYENCVHEGGGDAEIPGSSFDIRVPSKLINCAVRNHKGRAVVLRNNCMGFAGANRKSDGLTIAGFQARDCRTGIQWETSDQLFYRVPNPKDWPSGKMDIRDSQFTQIGGTGTGGCIDLRWTAPTTSGGTTFPVLGEVRIDNVLCEMNSAGHAIQIAGRWKSPRVSNVEVRAAPGYVGTGWRSVWFHNGGVATGENRPENAEINGIRYDANFTEPLDQGVSDRAVPSVASASAITPRADFPALQVTGTATINFLDNASLMFGKSLTLVFTGAATVRHLNGGNPGANAIWLAGGVNFNASANATLTVVSDGSTWREISRA